MKMRTKLARGLLPLAVLAALAAVPATASATHGDPVAVSDYDGDSCGTLGSNPDCTVQVSAPHGTAFRWVPEASPTAASCSHDMNVDVAGDGTTEVTSYTHSMGGGTVWCLYFSPCQLSWAGRIAWVGDEGAFVHRIREACFTSPTEADGNFTGCFDLPLVGPASNPGQRVTGMLADRWSPIISYDEDPDCGHYTDPSNAYPYAYSFQGDFSLSRPLQVEAL